MAVYHRTQRLQIYGEKPEVTKLFGDRYRMVVRCNAARDTEAWYNDNKDQIFADFGTLYGAQMSVDGIDPRAGEAYPDMCLVSNSASYTQTGEYVISFVYETLTAVWTKEQDDEITSTDNGLRVLQRSEVATIDAAAPYDEDDVGVSTITDGNKTLYLANFQDQTGADSDAQVGRVVTRWAEAGILNVRTPQVGGERRVTIEALGMTEAEVSSALSEVTAYHLLIDISKGNYEGFQTISYTFEVEEFEIISSSENGLKIATVTSLDTTNFTGGTIGVDTYAGGTLFLASEEIDNNNVIKKRVSRWAEAGILSQSSDLVGSQKAIVIQAFGEVPTTPAGYSLAKTDVSDFEGIQTNRYTFLKPSVLSRSIFTRNNGALIIETVEAFNQTPTADTVGAVQIGNDVSDVEGIPTRRYTFAKGSGQIQVSSRPASTALAGVTEVTVVSYGTPVTPTGVLISESESQEDGYIRYTKTALQGTITGVKQTYKDVVDVEVPGTVECTTVPVESGGVSGTLAVPLVTPRKNKKVAATVTVEITTTPPSTALLAFDLGAISCSVTTTNVSLSQGPGSTVTVGTNAVVSDTGYVQNFGASANIGVYPGCYLTNGSSTGTVSYITSSQPVASGNIITRNEASSSRNTTCTGTGEPAATGYSETGIISRKSRPILTTLAGTTYYEVITWSV